MLKEIKLASPRGFCAGVDRAIEIVNRALELYGPPVYVRHEVVHNRTVVANLRAKGAIFVEEVEAVPAGSLVIFSAHGVSKQVRAEAEEKGLRVFDATCPLVTKVHNEVVSFSRDQREAVLIGHAGHPEVEGTMGQYADPSRIYLIESVDDVDTLQIQDATQVSYVTQTTLSVDDTAKVIDRLRSRFPLIEGPRKDDICYATQNRQDAVKDLAQECDLILVVGSSNSSNSNRLRELAERLGVRAFLIDNATLIDPVWLEGAEVVGVTSGASAPESLVEEVVARLQLEGPVEVTTIVTREESIEFSLPKALRR
ncbi:MAG: 4-hydroxy-3-methylbut-2-enyl diphosphate reductase [SAR86 cluster bacterium]|jgi:4-hydroxy-3-methylbut-2-en-1-yl diphosphate reductase|uniref:4-hydroxy-3-methylbut-2-enyl diphosphate reductase n=1 Tax=SAR86 cluster bacterium TaxID=2030880 RepID=A0A972VU81_9GAMM|nr:4-hydroxy-3-methylbut-2-enyl diphosphate reductase [Pseudomonadales bacterium]NQV63863.1 4-hydroxy-3-methylbut-2-enyl diphosphate reductase [SAR86 cluster bacterium]|tara:strand:+ start:1639 stop:2574 length:936 start_codon:yes stop_codon:yes gene_type:complete